MAAGVSSGSGLSSTTIGGVITMGGGTRRGLIFDHYQPPQAQPGRPRQ